MKIGIIGAGQIGVTAAKLFAGAGYDVAISNSREPQTLEPLMAGLGSKVVAATPAGAAAFGEVILLALPWSDIPQLPPAELFAGKIVIDATNPYSPTGEIIDLGQKTSTGEVANRLKGARIVKAFNTMYYQTLASGGCTAPDERLVVFVAGDDVRAKSIVSRLIEEVGFAPVDTGSLHDGGRRQQPGAPLYDQPITLREARQILAGTC